MKEVGWGPPEDRDALEDAWRTNPIRVHNHPDGRVQIRLKFPFILLFGRVSHIGIYLVFLLDLLLLVCERAIGQLVFGYYI